MANIVDIVVNARDAASSVINGVGNSFSSLQGKAEKASGIIGGVLGATGAVMGAIAIAGVQMNKVIESSGAKWETLTGSVGGAEKQLAFIQKYAANSPFDFKGVDETATSMVGMGLSIKDVNNWIPTLGDIASVLGGGTETIKGVGTALGQMNAKGKVSAEEMMQLAERGVNGWQMIADGMGLSVAEVQKLAADGKLLAKDALPLIQKGMEKTFGGGTAKYMATTAGQWDNLIEGAQQFAGQLTQPIYDYFGSTILPALNSALGELSTMFSGGLAEGFAKLFDSKYAVAVTVLAGVIMGALVGALFLIAPAIGSAVVAFAPFLAIGLAVAALALIVMANWGTIKSFFIGIFEAIKPVVMGVLQAMQDSFANFKAALVPLWEAVKTLISSIMPIIIAVGIIVGTLLVIALAVFNGIVQAIVPLITAFVNLMTFVTNVVMAIVSLLTGDMDGAMKHWNTATQAAIDFFKNIWQTLVGFFSGIWNTLVQIFAQYGVDLNAKVAAMWAKAKALFQAGVQATAKFFTKLGTDIKQGATNMKNSIVNGFKSMWDSAKSTFNSGVNAVKNYFTNLVSTIKGKVSDIKNSLVNGFKTAMSSAKSAVSTGVNGIISAVKGFASTFLSAGKGLIEAFTKGIKSAIGGAVSAVKSGMSKVRDLLPFSPAKKGPLSDLDKSGKSFFPTWYDGALTQVRPMTRAIGSAMGSMNDQLDSGFGSVGLEAFSGGRTTVTVNHKHDHSGDVTVQGDTGKETLSMIGSSMQTTTESDIMSGLRQEIRKR